MYSLNSVQIFKMYNECQVENPIKSIETVNILNLNSIPLENFQV